MKTDAQTLPTDVLALQQMVAKLQRELDAKDAKYQRLLEQFRLAQHQRFGANGEAHQGKASCSTKQKISLALRILSLNLTPPR